jgi:hypothetical protein
MKYFSSPMDVSKAGPAEAAFRQKEIAYFTYPLVSLIEVIY